MANRDQPRLEELRQLKYDVVLDLYRQRARAVFAEKHDDADSQYLSQLFGDLIGSLACALDPYWQFIQLKPGSKRSALLATIFPVQVVPANRTYTFYSQFPVKSGYVEKSVSRIKSNHLVFTGSGYYVKDDPDAVGITTRSNTGQLVQEGLTGYRKDTTWKSRNPNQRLSYKTTRSLPNGEGEFELFVPTIVSGPNTYGFRRTDSTNHVRQAVGTNLWLISDQTVDVTGSYGPYQVSVSNSACQAYAAAERSYAISTMVKNMDAMLAKCVPTRRYFNLAYQIGEVKDIPQTLFGALQLWRDFEHLIGKSEFLKAWTIPKWWTKSRIHTYAPHVKRLGIDIDPVKGSSNAYLNFKFGWQSIYQAVLKLVKVPEKATNDVNRIIARNGKFTNLSNTRQWSEGSATSPTLNTVPLTDFLGPDSSKPAGQNVVKDILLRCMCNVGVAFPPLSVPRLKNQLFLEKVGLFPSPGDLYDLVPFTWMVDWFAGLGDYIHLMDRINGPGGPINYGFMTYKSSCHVTAEHRLKGVSTTSRYNSPPDSANVPGFTETKNIFVDFSGGLHLKYELRLSVASLVNVKTYSGQGLSQDQKTILGALISKYA